MEEINYIDIKERINRIVNRLATDLEQSYSNESTYEQLTKYLEKYGCISVKELIYLFLCESKPDDLNISLNMRKKINNITDEINQSELNGQHSQSIDEKYMKEIKELKEKVKIYENMLQEYNQSTSKLMKHFNNKKTSSPLPSL